MRIIYLPDLIAHMVASKLAGVRGSRTVLRLIFLEYDRPSVMNQESMVRSERNVSFCR